MKPVWAVTVLVALAVVPHIHGLVGYRNYDCSFNTTGMLAIMQGDVGIIAISRHVAGGFVILVVRVERKGRRAAITLLIFIE